LAGKYINMFFYVCKIFCGFEFMSWVEREVSRLGKKYICLDQKEYFLCWTFLSWYIYIS